MVALLTRLNCKVSQAEDGQECVDLFKPLFALFSTTPKGIKQEVASKASEPFKRSSIDMLVPFDVILMDNTMRTYNTRTDRSAVPGASDAAHGPLHRVAADSCLLVFGRCSRCSLAVSCPGRRVGDSPAARARTHTAHHRRHRQRARGRCRRIHASWMHGSTHQSDTHSDSS
jgi:hypothetical protein